MNKSTRIIDLSSFKDLNSFLFKLYEVAEHYNLQLEIGASVGQYQHYQVGLNDGSRHLWEYFVTYKCGEYNNGIWFDFEDLAIYDSGSNWTVSVRLNEKYENETIGALKFYVNSMSFELEELEALFIAYENNETLPDKFIVKFDSVKCLLFRNHKVNNQKLLARVNACVDKQESIVDPLSMKLESDEFRVVELVIDKFNEQNVSVNYVRLAGFDFEGSPAVAVLTDHRIFKVVWDNFLNGYSEFFEETDLEMPSIKVEKNDAFEGCRCEIAALKSAMNLKFGGDIPSNLSDALERFLNVFKRY